MGNLGGGEILVILVVGLLVLGPQRLPTVGRQVGRVIAELRRVSSGFREEFRAALENPLEEAKGLTSAAQLQFGAEVADNRSTGLGEATGVDTSQTDD